MSYNGRLSGRLQIKRTAHALASTIEHVRVDHSRLYVPVSEQLVNRSIIVAALQQVGGKAVAKSVTATGFLNPGRTHRRAHGSLQRLLINMMSANNPRSRVL